MLKAALAKGFSRLKAGILNVMWASIIMARGGTIHDLLQK
jgi:hypothetical protein